MYTYDEIKNLIKDLKVIHKAVGYGFVLEGHYVLQAYKGKYGQGYKVMSKAFLAKDGKFYNSCYYYCKS